jgi:shikimate 5-dehydrogenase
MDLVDLTAHASIDRELVRCRDKGFRGVNVTRPYKRDVFAHVTPIGLSLFVACSVAKADLV